MDIHPSGWFSYHSKYRNRARRQIDYVDCVLLRDLTLRDSALPMHVSFHQDDMCRRGAHIPWISESMNEPHLYGWTLQEEPILDLYYGANDEIKSN
jgi:hypothetical protein